MEIAGWWMTPCWVNQTLVTILVAKWGVPARKMGVSQARWLVDFMEHPIKIRMMTGAPRFPAWTLVIELVVLQFRKFSGRAIFLPPSSGAVEGWNLKKQPSIFIYRMNISQNHSKSLFSDRELLILFQHLVAEGSHIWIDRIPVETVV